jgi:hypothetical protein
MMMSFVLLVFIINWKVLNIRVKGLVITFVLFRYFHFQNNNVNFASSIFNGMQNGNKTSKSPSALMIILVIKDIGRVI